MADTFDKTEAQYRAHQNAGDAPPPKSPGPRRRAREMVTITRDPHAGRGDSYLLCLGSQVLDRYETRAWAERRAGELRAILAREFRRVRRAALLRHAHAVRRAASRASRGVAIGLRHAAAMAEALARGGRKGGGRG